MFIKNLKRNYILYLFVLPALIYIIIFSYGPMYGIQIAFKDFRAASGIWNSRWVGLLHFKDFFSSYNFKLLIVNTLTISVYSLILGFPVPIILALAINYSRFIKLSKFAQSAAYAPHFISTVVLVGMVHVFLSPSGGFINKIYEVFTGTTINFMGNPQMFKHIYVLSGIWQNMGWSSIIYVAALIGIPPEFHEAAIVDGASKMQRILYIDIPCIMPTAVILLILSCGSIMNVGFEKVFLLQNDLNLKSSEIISTYVYKIGLLNARYSFSAAIGLFNNIINFIILLSVNKLAGTLTNTALW